MKNYKLYSGMAFQVVVLFALTMAFIMALKFADDSSVHFLDASNYEPIQISKGDITPRSQWEEGV